MSNTSGNNSRPFGDGESSMPTSSQAPQPDSSSGVNTNAAGRMATMTITETETRNSNEEVLRLTLTNRPAVTWWVASLLETAIARKNPKFQANFPFYLCRDEAVIDNEGLGRKSSKRCCIFHKQRAFGESSTDSSDNDSDGGSSSSSGGPGGGKKKAITRKKQGKIEQDKVPDFQRYHA